MGNGKSKQKRHTGSDIITVRRATEVDNNTKELKQLKALQPPRTLIPKRSRGDWRLDDSLPKLEASSLKRLQTNIRDHFTVLSKELERNQIQLDEEMRKMEVGMVGSTKQCKEETVAMEALNKGVQVVLPRVSSDLEDLTQQLKSVAAQVQFWHSKLWQLEDRNGKEHTLPSFQRAHREQQTSPSALMQAWLKRNMPDLPEYFAHKLSRIKGVSPHMLLQFNSDSLADIGVIDDTDKRTILNCIADLRRRLETDADVRPSKPRYRYTVANSKDRERMRKDEFRQGKGRAR